MIGYDNEGDSYSKKRQFNMHSANSAMDYILDAREYDVPYYVRAAIDNGMLTITATRPVFNNIRFSCRSLVHSVPTI